MERNQKQNSGMTPKQKQAAIVCAICMLALIVTISVTAVQVIKASDTSSMSTSSDSTSTTPEPGYTGEDYVIDANANSAVLTETADQGKDYLKETLFIGDSNTVRFYNNGLLTTQQFCALEGLTIQNALTEKFVAFKKDANLYTIAESVAKMKPRRVVITLGSNNADGSMSADAFVAAYKSLTDAIVASYGYTDVIINAIPPVMESQTSYPDLSQETIDSFNMSLAAFAQESGYKFLNSAEALKDNTGYGDDDYYVSNDIHLKAAGLNAILDYVTTHAYIADDRRPDTNNIAIRTGSASTNTGSNSNSSSSSTATEYTAKYFVDSAGGGTLTSGDDKGKTNLTFDVEDKDDSITVTAVPNDGYVFVKWSDNVKTAKRTDTDFDQNVNVTAMFGTVGISIKLNTPKEEVKAGKNIEFEATLTGGYASINDIVWYVNDEKNAASAIGKSWLTIESNTDYVIYAAVTYNGTTIKSPSITIEQEKLIKVPDLVGNGNTTEADAKAALTAAGLAIGTISRPETTDSAQIGKVTHQETAAGTEVVAGSAINFTVPKEAKTYEVPNVVGQTADTATSAIKAAGFTGKIDTTSKTAYSNTIAKGSVIFQNPSAGSKAVADTSFVLTISLGVEPPATAQVPTVTGTTEEEALAAIKAKGFTSVTVSYSDGCTAATASTNIVTACTSEGGTVAVNTAITLTVKAATPAPTPTPTATPDTGNSTGSDSNSTNTDD